jgi:photosystem II stability/assembly factor-like uncharacterized protein
MARIPSSNSVSYSCLKLLLPLSLLLFPLMACVPGTSDTTRAAPPSDPTCRTSATSKSNIDHRYLSGIAMQNATTGWGQNYTQKGGVPSGVPTAEQTILHTADAGCHWTLVKSWKYSMEPSPEINAFFLSATMAIVYVNGKFFLTRDGGMSWSSPTLPVGAELHVLPQHIFFINEHLGWMLAAFSHEGVLQPSDLLHSTDGARSWTHLHTSFPIALDAGNRITSLSFLNEAIGWITGTSSDLNGKKRSWIFLTHDGGKSWHEQRLPAPQGYASSSSLVLGQPRFFSPHDGILPAATSLNPPVGISSFLTHDRGESWQAQPFFPLTDVAFNPELGGPQIPTFTSPSTGWSSILTGEGRDTPASLSLFRTTDAGRSWQPFNQSLPVRPSDPGFQFITDRVVFALAYTGEAVNFQAPSQLYRTTDGGKTWTTLHYTIS